MVLVEILDRPAIADHIAGKAPFLAQDLLEQRGTAAARLAVGAVVRAHDRPRAGFLHAGLERRQVGLAQIAGADNGIETVAQRFRAAVHRVVLGRRDQLEIPGMIALQALHKRHPHPGC